MIYLSFKHTNIVNQNWCFISPSVHPINKSTNRIKDRSFKNRKVQKYIFLSLNPWLLVALYIVKWFIISTVIWGMGTSKN